MAEELGARGVMVTPSKEGVPMSDDAMVQHFQSIAAGINIPIVLQDHPGSTSVHMSLKLLERLVVEVGGPRVFCFSCCNNASITRACCWSCIHICISSF